MRSFHEVNVFKRELKVLERNFSFKIYCNLLIYIFPLCTCVQTLRRSVQPLNVPYVDNKKLCNLKCIHRADKSHCAATRRLIKTK